MSAARQVTTSSYMHWAKTKSTAKFNLATQILRRRFRHEAEVDRAQLITFANEIADSAHTAEASERIRHIFADA